MNEDDKETVFSFWGFDFYANVKTLIALTFFIILIALILVGYYILESEDINTKGCVIPIVVELLLILCWIIVFSKWRKKKKE